MFLHAKTLAFTHPDGGRTVTVESKLPLELERYIQWLDSVHEQSG